MDNKEIEEKLQEICSRLNVLEKSRINRDFSAFYCKKCGEKLKIKYERGNPLIYFVCPNDCDIYSDILNLEQLVAIINS